MQRKAGKDKEVVFGDNEIQSLYLIFFLSLIPRNNQNRLQLYTIHIFFYFRNQHRNNNSDHDAPIFVFYLRQTFN